MPNNTKTIIVYRSQQEQFWDQAIMSGDAFVYLAWFILIAATFTLCVYLWGKYTKPKYRR